MITVRMAKPSEFDSVKKFIRSIFPDAIIQLEDEDTVLVAEHEGKKVGFAHIIEEDDKVLLQGVGVEPSFRSHGVGTLLIERALDLLQDIQKPVYLKVKALNPVMELYARHGFSLKKFGDTHVLVKKANA